MGITEFVFAFFIFILVCLAIIFYAKIVRPSKAKEDSSTDKEKKLFKLYQNLEDMMNGIEEYVEEARKEIDESKSKMAALLEKAMQIQKKLHEQKPPEDPKRKDAPKSKEETPAKTLRNMNKNDLVRYLRQEGLDDEKIAKELEISRGEVSLILGMKK